MHTFGPFCYEFENVEEEIVDVCGEHRTAVVVIRVGKMWKADRLAQD